MKKKIFKLEKYREIEETYTNGFYSSLKGPLELDLDTHLR